MAEVIGVQYRKYTSKENRPVEGYNLFVTYPREGVVGTACEAIWCSPNALQDALTAVGGADGLIGSAVKVLYNRWGRAEGVELLDSAENS